jgi:lipopolysaccharide transport system permease protein
VHQASLTNAAASQHQELIIEAGRTEGQYWRDLWRYRELLVFLAWRDVLVRYRQTFIGIAWAVLRPAVSLIVLTFVFGTVAKLPSDGRPYPLLVLAALLPWQFFATALTDASGSLLSNAALVSKIYFPRLLMPASAVVVSAVDFLFGAVMFLALMAWHGQWPTWRIASLPLFTLLGVLASLGFGVWLAALNVRFRDVRQIVPFAIQVGLLVSPVAFVTAVVPERWRLVYALNPMVGVIEGYRWALLGMDAFWPAIGLSCLLTTFLLLSGVWYFRRTERSFADVI